MKTTNVLIFFLFLFIICSCSEETEYKLLKGTIIGHVNDGYHGNPIAGVDIDVEGSEPKIHVTTDSTGKFLIENVNSGTYDIVFCKTGYCMNRINSYQYVGGDLPVSLNTEMYLLPQTHIDSISIKNTSHCCNEIWMKIDATISNFDGNANYRFYFHNTPEVSYREYTKTETLYEFQNEYIIYDFKVDTINFPVGSSLYIKVYPCMNSLQGYTDINTGKYIYTSLDTGNCSETINIVIPAVQK